MTRWISGRTTARGRREAELFHADLLGVWRPARRVGAESFGELFGEHDGRPPVGTARYLREEGIPVETASTASAVTIQAASGLGTERTTAPIAEVSPQRQMNEILDRELVLFAKARVLAEWLDRRFSATFEEAFRDSALVAQLDRSRDTALLQRLRPFRNRQLPDRRAQLFTTDAGQSALLGPPRDAHALWPILDVLSFYGVVLLVPDRANPFGNPRITANVSRTGAGLERARFDIATAAVESFAGQFKTRVANSPRPHHVVAPETAPDAYTNPSAPITHRTFASSVVSLLRRVRARNDRWRAGTYPNHFWNDFSADMYIVAGRAAAGFYERGAVRSFFRALNAACEDASPPGKFAWKAIYNDEAIAREMDGLFGAGRVLFGVTGHGPGPDMHVHLDLRPLTVPFDATTGFWLDGSRVVLSPPPARPSVPMPAPSLP